MILCKRKKKMSNALNKTKEWLDVQSTCLFWKQTWTSSRCFDAIQFCYHTHKKNHFFFLHKGLDAYNISDVLCLEMPATSGFPALLIDFVFTKDVYLKLHSLARIAAECKGFPSPSVLFTLFKVDCCGVQDVLTALVFFSLHYFNGLSLLCGILACTVY